MIDTIYIARHGFRQNWVTSTWKSPTGTPRDPPLAAYGEQQAKELAAFFASLPPEDRPTAIFSSPYYRCMQTSAPVAEALDLPIYLEHGIAEWYSPVASSTGLHPRPDPASSLARSFPAFRIDPEGWSPTWVPSRKGETIEAVHDRCNGFLRAFIPRVEQLSSDGGKQKHKKILLVSHAATIIALTRELVGDRDLTLRVACCSLTTLVRRPEDCGAGQTVGVWRARELATGDFLEGGLERDWGFEDVELNGREVVRDLGVPGTEAEEEKDFGLQVASKM